MPVHYTPSVNVMGATVPIKEGEKQSINGYDFVSVLNGDRFVLVKQKPIEFAEKDPIASAQIASLEAKIDGLDVGTIKADVTSVQDKYKALETDKADKTAVASANTAIKELDTALKALAALPPEVSEAQLNAAIADYTKKLKAADDAIAVAKTSSDKATTDITALAATVAAVEAAFKSADKTLGDKNTAQDTAIAAVKATADKAATDVATLQAAIALDNTGFTLNGGALFTAAEAIDKDFVHITTAGKIEIARNSVDSKPADGYVSGTIAAGGTTQVFGTGSKFAIADFGLVGVPSTAWLYLGDGGATLSNTGTGRYFQEIALVRGGVAYMSFTDRGYWVAAT